MTEGYAELRDKLESLEQVQESVILHKARYQAAARKDHPWVAGLIETFLPGYSLHKNPVRKKKEKEVSLAYPVAEE